jgi:exonuclease VII small subunit
MSGVVTRAAVHELAQSLSTASLALDTALALLQTGRNERLEGCLRTASRALDTALTKLHDLPARAE